MTFAVSASQIDTYRTCKRRWAWGKIAGIESPQHPSATLGEEVHGHKERWHKQGTVPDDSRAGKIAKEGLDAPPPAGVGDVENKFRFDAGGVMWTGRKDLEYRDDGEDPDIVPGAPVVGGLVVRDYKTTSNFSYAKTPETLATDAQGVLYAAESFRRVPDNDLLLDWFYLRTKKPGHRRVQLRVFREDVEKQMNDVMIPTGQELFRLRSAGVDPLSLPATTSACHLYPPDGCPYRHLCTDLTDTQKLHALMKGSRMPKNLTARLAAAQKTTDDAPAEAPKKETLAEKVGVRAEGINPPPRAPLKEDPPGVAAAPKGSISDIVARLTRLGCDRDQIAERLHHEFPNLSAEGIDEVLAGSAPTDPPPAVAEEPKKRGPGRPRKPPSVQLAEAAEALQPPPAVNAPAVSDAPPPVGTGYRLFINAVPLKGSSPAVPFGTIFEQVHALVCKEAEVPHYKLIDYGKGAGALNVVLNDYLKASAFDGCTVLIDSRTPEGADCLGTMMAHAREVVRGA